MLSNLPSSSNKISSFIGPTGDTKSRTVDSIVSEGKGLAGKLYIERTGLVYDREFLESLSYDDIRDTEFEKRGMFDA